MRPLCQRGQHPLHQRLQCLGFNGDGRTERVTRVGTHDLCVRCVKGYSDKALTGRNALSLETRRASLLQLYVSWFDNGRTDRASLQQLYVGWFDNGRTDRASLQRLYVSL